MGIKNKYNSKDMFLVVVLINRQFNKIFSVCLFMVMVVSWNSSEAQQVASLVGNSLMSICKAPMTPMLGKEPQLGIIPAVVILDSNEGSGYSDKKENNKFLKSIPDTIKYANTYDGHLQGIATDRNSSLFWSHTTQLVKTDFKGNIIKVIDVPGHHGDLDYYDNKIYVAVNFGRFNEEKGQADSWVYIYKSKDLSFVKKYPIPEVIHGSGGLAIHNKKIMVVGGLPDNGKYNENLVYEYNLKFELIKIHKLKSGYTQLGIQTATFFNDCWYFGCYGSSSKSLSPVVLKAQLINGSLKLKNIYQNDFSLGIVGLYNNRWLVSGRLFDFSAHVVQWEN